MSGSKPTNRLAVRFLMTGVAGLLCVAPFVENYERIDIATGRLRTVYQAGPFALSGRVRETRFSKLARSPDRADEVPQWRTVYSSWFFGAFSGGCYRSGGVPGDLDAFVGMIEEPHSSPDTKRAAVESVSLLLVQDDPDKLNDFLSELTRQLNARRPWDVESAMSKAGRSRYARADGSDPP